MTPTSRHNQRLEITGRWSLPCALPLTLPLQAVKGIHDLKIVHSDLKPANFLLVQGQLKLIDFGIAKSIQGDTTSINRESQVRAELLLWGKALR